MNSETFNTALIAELARAPYAGKTDAELPAALKANGFFAERLHQVPMGLVSLHMQTYLFPKLELAVVNPATSVMVRVVAKGAIQLPQSPHIPTLDMWDIDFQHSLGVLMQAGVFSSEDVERLLDLARVAVTLQDIQRARNNDAIAALQVLQEQTATAWGEVLILLQGRRRALEAGEVAEVPIKAQVLTAFSEALG